MSISLGLFARPPSHVSSQSHESALPSSPSRMGLDQSCTSHSSESSGVPETARNLPTSPSSLVIKEEPCDIDTVLIKWEMSEERFGEHQESSGSPCQDNESPTTKKKTGEQRGQKVQGETSRRPRWTQRPSWRKPEEQEEGCADVRADRGGSETEEGSLESSFEAVLRPKNSPPTGKPLTLCPLLLTLCPLPLTIRPLPPHYRLPVFTSHLLYG